MKNEFRKKPLNVSINNLKFNIMTTNQKIRLRMYLGTRNFVSQNEAIAKAIPKFATSYANLLSTIEEIQLIGEMQGRNFYFISFI